MWVHTEMMLRHLGWVVMQFFPVMFPRRMNLAHSENRDCTSFLVVSIKNRHGIGMSCPPWATNRCNIPERSWSSYHRPHLADKTSQHFLLSNDLPPALSPGKVHKTSPTAWGDMDHTWHTNSSHPVCSLYCTQDLYLNDLPMQHYFREKCLRELQRKWMGLSSPLINAR